MLWFLHYFEPKTFMSEKEKALSVKVYFERVKFNLFHA